LWHFWQAVIEGSITVPEFVAEASWQKRQSTSLPSTTRCLAWSNGTERRRAAGVGMLDWRGRGERVPVHRRLAGGSGFRGATPRAVSCRQSAKLGAAALWQARQPL